MLRHLQNRLRIFLIIIFMTVVSLILCFSFWNTWQARQIADITYIQRMASLIIYQLEADPDRPVELLSNYEREMNVYSILKDNAGNILYQSDPDTLTDLDTLGKIAEESIEIQSPTNHTNFSQTYSCIWLLAFVCILFVSRFLLRRAFEPTERVLQSQKDFVAAASHELKSPLAVIMANVENIQNIEIAEPQAQNHLKVIDTECMRMSRLVRDMLLLASSDADKWTIQIQEVNVDTLLIMLYEAYEPVCRKKAIHLDLNLGEESYPQLHTDQERLFQILSIFLDNAVSYAPENSSIEIQTRWTSRELTFS